MTTKTRRAPNRTATRIQQTPYMLGRQTVLERANDVRNVASPAEYGETLVELRDAVETAIVTAVSRMRFDGLSWSEIGEALHMTTQGAHRKYASSTSDDDLRPIDTGF